MFSFNLTFTTYSDQRGTRINSAPTRVVADDFHAACRLADAMLEGMQAAALPGHVYRVESVVDTSVGGERATGHGGIFSCQTLEEWARRIEARESV